jgi:TolB protein
VTGHQLGTVQIVATYAGVAGISNATVTYPIVFTSYRNGNANLYAINPDGTNEARLTDQYDLFPSRSPDGMTIAFETKRYGANNQLATMNADGSNVVRLTNSAGDDLYPAWSPDGARIAFASRRDGNYEIYVMHADGTNPVRLTNHAADDLYPSWR